MSTVYVELHSGFGNQIFQYALAMSLEVVHGFKTYILPSQGNTHSKKNYQEFFKLVTHATNSPANAVTINRKKTPFDWWDVKTLCTFHTVRLSGYHQNYRLFKSVVPKVATELRATFDKIYGAPTWNPLSTGFIHVRRGDYFLPHIKMYNLQMEYYEDAIYRIQSINPEIKWIIASDDIAWCNAQTWPTIYPVEFFESDDELKTFWCLLNCKGAAIIANSTFSYWGALLSAHQVRSPIVYPAAWHLENSPELFPSSWIRAGSKEISLKLPC